MNFPIREDGAPDITRMLAESREETRRELEELYGEPVQVHSLLTAADMENRISAQSSLVAADEAIARQLAELSSEYAYYDYSCNPTTAPQEKELRDRLFLIGQQLDAEGGLTRMQYICYRVNVLESRNALNYIWDGIGDWRS